MEILPNKCCFFNLISFVHDTFSGITFIFFGAERVRVCTRRDYHHESQFVLQYFWFRIITALEIKKQDLG